MHQGAPPQLCPQVPQFLVSSLRFTHCLLQQVNPAWHGGSHLQGFAAGSTQVPAQQTWPGGHASPHAPQLVGSVSRFVQTPWQQVSAGSTNEQTLPQAPQSNTLVFRSAQE
jgi:hypothetical protein